MAKVIGIGKDERQMISIYDPTCGSGSLLLRAKAEARHNVSIDGQEKDLATIGMAKMSMISTVSMMPSCATATPSTTRSIRRTIPPSRLSTTWLQIRLSP